MVKVNSTRPSGDASTPAAQILVRRRSGLAVAGVLGYRAFESWLAVAYVRLLRTVGEWDDSEITQSM